MPRVIHGLMATAVAMGATPTSQEVSGLGEAALFSRLHPTSLGFCVFKRVNKRRTASPVWRRLVYASDTKIRRHIKIRQTANPFDPQWRAYFKERAFFKKFGISCRQAGIKPS